MLSNLQIKDILINQNYVDLVDIIPAFEVCETNNQDLIEYLVEKRIISKNLIGQALGEFYKVDFADLEAHPPLAEIILDIPEEIAEKYGILCFALDEQKIYIATNDPSNTLFLEALNSIFPSKEFIILFAFEEDIKKEYLNYDASLKSQFEKALKNTVSGPEIFKEIIKYAANFNVSDVHIEPTETDVQIRFRIDGILQYAANINKEVCQIMTNHLKVISHIKTDEVNSFLDGVIRYQYEDQKYADLRISIAPTIKGQKVTIRVISKKLSFLNLKILGMSDKDAELVEKSFKRPFGLILTCGPTGAGKTTTLYSILQALNKPQVNITTIEDPVETRLVGINQIQVNNDTDITFAQGLRSIVRQDLDVIMVGEVRDQETAKVCINAALTGHLLLSTFHSSDSFSVVPRIINMGIEPYLLASTLSVIITQRLVRKICNYCRVSININALPQIRKEEIFTKYFNEDSIVFYGKGCNACNGTGYKDRTGVFEIIKVSENIQNLILTQPSSNQIKEVAKQEGTLSFFEDGIQKVKLGITTIDELIRVSVDTF